jgi:hypothetical protein
MKQLQLNYNNSLELLQSTDRQVRKSRPPQRYFVLLSVYYILVFCVQRVLN